MADLIDRLRQEAGLPDREAARRALRSVVCCLRERLDEEESEALRLSLASFPEIFQCSDPAHTHRPAEKGRDRMTEPELAERVRRELAMSDLASARKLVRLALAALSEGVGDETEAPAANEAVSVGALARPRRPSGNDDDES